jgi:hypothetical protein
VVAFSAYPVMFLWAQNLSDDVPAADALGLIVAMVAGGLVVTAVAWAFLRDLSRAALIGSICILSFAPFGRAARELAYELGGRRETWLLVGWLAGTALLIFLVTRLRRVSPGFTQMLNLIAGALVVLNAVPVIARGATPGEPVSAAWPLDTTGMDPGAAPRDVYYLIFDRYAGERTLHDLYDFDNSAFIQRLRERGFLVVDDALANYPQTTHSLASSLNLTHLHALAEEVGRTSGNWGPLRASLGASTVSRTFQALGYRYVHIGSWWEPTWDDPTADTNYTYGGLGEFSGVFSATTMWPAIATRLGMGASQDQRLQQFERVAFQIDAVAETARDPDPTFTFAHFTLPHTPYVFMADGSFAPDVYRTPEEGYLEQLRYTNTAIEGIVDDILRAPGPEPIIVVQSDEGPHPPQYDYAGNITWAWSEQSDLELGRKLRILEALYLPGLEDRSGYEDLTPVNTFRLLLDDYFGAHLGRLADRTYVFDDYEHPYRFVEVTDRLRSDA